MLQSTCENRIRAGRQEREGDERGGRQSGKSKFALTAREAELLALTCCKKGKKRKKKEREKKGREGKRELKVSLIFPTIIPPVLLLVAGLLFGKLKGPTPSRSRHHSLGTVLVLLTKDDAKSEWCEHRFTPFRIRSSGKSATDGEISKPSK